MMEADSRVGREAARSNGLQGGGIVVVVGWRV